MCWNHLVRNHETFLRNLFSVGYIVLLLNHKLGDQDVTTIAYFAWNLQKTRVMLIQLIPNIYRKYNFHIFSSRTSFLTRQGCNIWVQSMIRGIQNLLDPFLSKIQLIIEAYIGPLGKQLIWRQEFIYTNTSVVVLGWNTSFMLILWTILNNLGSTKLELATSFTSGCWSPFVVLY